MVAGPLADGPVACACSQEVSEPVSWLHVLFADGLVTFSCFQYVGEPVSWLYVLLLMVLWHLPVLRK
jgi:hypothetical protein